MDQKAFHMTLLFDFYGDLLTDRQKEFYDLYHNEDLSLAEIAENAGITRQGVRDVLVRAENTLEELEAKTGIVRRFLVVRSGLNTIEEAAKRIDFCFLERPVLIKPPYFHNFSPALHRKK